MRIAIRTHAGKHVGYGHLRRCMTLADALRAHGANVTFVEHDAFEADGVIADSYELDAAWFAKMRQRTTLLVIDDLADRVIDADLVTNSAVGAADMPYRTGENCQLLLGPTYALVRPAFRDAAHARRSTVERVLVTLGGSDPQFRTRAVVGALQTLLAPAVHIDVVIGPLHGEDAPLDELARGDARVVLHRGVTDISSLFAAADLAVSGGGQTTFELAAAGLPAVALAVAANQRHVLAGFEGAGTLLAADTVEAVVAGVERVIGDAALRDVMSAAGRRLVDGQGPARVAAALLEQIRD